MNILAMDTSTLTATVAVLNEEKLLGEFTVCNKLTHSQMIMPMLDTLLKTISISVNDIDVFATSVGPGSFTGLRIGMASIKTLAQALDKPVIGVSSLDAVAENFSFTDCIICPIMDARHSEVYNALYHNGKEIVKSRAVNINTLLEELNGKNVVFAGDGVLTYGELIKSFENEKWMIAPPNFLLPRASSVAAAALKRAAKGDFDNTYTLNPVYLKKSQAERELEEKNKKQNTEEKK